MASTHKKVVVRKLDRDSVNGYVASGTFLNDGKIELLNTAGNVVLIDLKEVKGVYFVREFADSEALTRKTFTTRPRVEGLWVRMRFKDNEVFEALMTNDITQMGPDGVFLSPPDTRSNTQKIFVPRAAIGELIVLAVIGAHSRRKKQPGEDVGQVPLFG